MQSPDWPRIVPGTPPRTSAARKFGSGEYRDRAAYQVPLIAPSPLATPSLEDVRVYERLGGVGGVKGCDF